MQHTAPLCTRSRTRSQHALSPSLLYQSRPERECQQSVLRSRRGQQPAACRHHTPERCNAGISPSQQSFPKERAGWLESLFGPAQRVFLSCFLLRDRQSLLSSNLQMKILLLPLARFVAHKRQSFFFFFFLLSFSTMPTFDTAQENSLGFQHFSSAELVNFCITLPHAISIHLHIEEWQL